MPVFEVASDGAPLRQGDVLKQLTFFASTVDGLPEPAISSHGVILSRHCEALRGEQLIIAALGRYSGDALGQLFDPRDTASISANAIDRLRRDFAAIRDGEGTPNTLYLGDLSGFDGRACIRLDRIYTIKVPTPPEERAAWTKIHRLATLSADYRRHLHNKFFAAIATEGFDEIEWLSTEDLKFFIAIGKSYSARVEVEKRTLQTQLMQAEALGNDPKKLEALRKQLQSVDDKVQRLAADLQPYQDALHARAL